MRSNDRRNETVNKHRTNESVLNTSFSAGEKGRTLMENHHFVTFEQQPLGHIEQNTLPHKPQHLVTIRHDRDAAQQSQDKSPLALESEAPDPKKFLLVSIEISYTSRWSNMCHPSATPLILVDHHIKCRNPNWCCLQRMPRKTTSQSS